MKNFSNKFLFKLIFRLVLIAPKKKLSKLFSMLIKILSEEDMEKEQDSFLGFLYSDQSGDYINYLSVNDLNDLIDVCFNKIKYYQSVYCNNSFSDRIMLRIECHKNTDQFFFPVARSRDINKQDKISLHGYVLDCQIDRYSSDFIFCVMIGNEYRNTDNIREQRLGRRQFQDFGSNHEFYVLNILHYKFFAIEIDDVELPQKEYLINFPDLRLLVRRAGAAGSRAVLR